MSTTQYEYGLYVNETDESPPLVFINTGSQDGLLKIQHGQTEHQIDPSNWNPIQGDGFLPGDQVQVLSRDGLNTARIAVISRMEWQPESKKIIYILENRSRIMKKQYFIEDLTRRDNGRFHASNPELEIAIQNNPNDTSALAVYADWLQSQNDPRGEMLALELALKQNPENPDIARRRRDLMLTHLEQFINESQSAAGMGEDKYMEIKLDWYGGFLKKAEAQIESTAHDEREIARAISMEKYLSGLLDANVSNLLTELRLDIPGNTILNSITQGRPRPALRRLTLRGELELDLHQLLNKTPNMERLAIEGALLDSDKPQHSNLQTLKLNVKNDSLSRLLDAHLPNLENLSLGLTHFSPAMAQDLKHLFNTESLFHLKHLELAGNYTPRDYIAFQTIIPSQLRKHLDTLTFKIRELSQEGAEFILENQSNLEHLKELNIKYRVENIEHLTFLENSFTNNLKLHRILWSTQF